MLFVQDIAAATPWYSTSSSLFWVTIALVIIGIATAFVTVLVWRSAIVRPRLLCNIVSRWRMVNAPLPMPGELQISYENEVLDDPCMVALEIANVARVAISSGSFDQGRGVVFELGAQVVKVLDVYHEPRSAPKPTILERGSQFELKPELIAGGEIIRMALLTRGPVENVKVVFNSLGNAAIDIRDREEWIKKRSRRLNILAYWLGLVLSGTLVGIVVTLFSIVQSSHRTINNLNTIAISARGWACANLDTALAELQDVNVQASRDVHYKLGKGGAVSSLTFSPQYQEAVADVGDTNILVSIAYNAAYQLGISIGSPGKWFREANEQYRDLTSLPRDHPGLQQNSDLAAVRESYNQMQALAPRVGACTPYLPAVPNPEPSPES